MLHPFEAKVKSDKKYRVSLWAKSKSEGAQLEVGLGESQKQRFRLTQDWEEYSFTCSSGQISGGTGLSLTLKSAGTVWVDLFQIVSLEE